MYGLDVRIPTGRLALLAAVLTIGCSAQKPGVTVDVPEPEAGLVRLAARAGEALGEVQPVAVAITNGEEQPLALNARQVFARSAAGERIAPLPAAEAARRAGGHRMPGAVERGAKGAVTGGALGAAGGAISGAIQGGVGLATGAGAAVGALFGALGGALGGGRQPDVAGFEARALRDESLGRGFSATGYVYYPAGTYGALEILLTASDGAVRTVTAPVTPAD